MLQLYPPRTPLIQKEGKTSIPCQAISEKSMQIKDVKTAFLMKQNDKLEVEVEDLKAALQVTQAKIASIESSYKIAQANLNLEKTNSESTIKKLELKLQSTQDLLMIKMNELKVTHQNNVSLKDEIDSLRNLVEEGKRLGMSSNNCLTLKLSEHFNDIVDETSCDSQKNEAMKKTIQRDENSNLQFLSSPQVSSGILPENSSLFSLLKMPRRPSSVPMITKGFMRGSLGASGINLFESPLATPSLNNFISSSQFFEGNTVKSLNGSNSTNDFKSSDDESDDESGIVPVNVLIQKERKSSICRRNSDVPEPNHLPLPPEAPVPKKLPRRPASCQAAKFVSADAGQGRDYFDAMFNDAQKSTLSLKVSGSSVDTEFSRPSSSSNDFSQYPGCSTGNVKVVDIDVCGRFVRVHNLSSTRIQDIGGYTLQQTVAGKQVSKYRFPSRTELPPGHTTTVWSSTCPKRKQEPPNHYISKDLESWKTGLQCTTILCNSNGQAVAWMASIPQQANSNRFENYWEGTYGRVPVFHHNSSHTSSVLSSEVSLKTSPPPAPKKDNFLKNVPQAILTHTQSAPLPKYVFSSTPPNRETSSLFNPHKQTAKYEVDKKYKSGRLRLSKQNFRATNSSQRTIPSTPYGNTIPNR